jgi:hypothetical protein
MLLSKEQVKSRLGKYWGTYTFKFIAEFHRPKNQEGGF